MAKKRKPKAYEVGYAKPPRSGQFKKGQSGNPKGRVKGSESIMTLFEKHGKRQVTIKEGGQRNSISKHEAIVLQIVNQAASGNPGAIKQYLQLALMMEGKQEASSPREFSITREDQEIIQEIAKRARKSKKE